MSTRIVFIQLARQDTNGDAASENIPYAGARLIALAEASGALPRSAMALLDQDLCDYGGDAAICRALADAPPELILFTLESHNLDRSIWLARRLRSMLPATQLAAFGPETAAAEELFREKAFDAVIEGEPEASFLELVRDLGHKALRPRYQAKSPPDFAALPDPYLAGVITPDHKKPVVFEASRGVSRPLPHRRHLRNEPIRALDAVGPRLLRLASDADAPGFTILGDPLPGEGRAGLIKAYAAANEHGVAVRAEIDPTEADDEEARLWADAALSAAAFCLPGLGHESLSALGLALDRSALERGVQRFWSQGLGLKPELLIGLPKESYEAAVEGFDFLGMLGIGQDTELSPLPLPPGSRLRASAAELGLREYLERPPYWVVETEWMEEDDILDAIADFEESFDVALSPPVQPSFAERRGGFIAFADLRKPGGLDKLLMNAERLASSLSVLAPADDRDALRRLASAAKDLRKENPFTLWQLVLYSDAALPQPKELDRLADAFCMPEHFFELSHVYSMDPQPGFQARIFFATSSEALALQAIRERQELETLLALGPTLPSIKLLELKPFLIMEKDGMPFELLYEVLSAYREYPELLLDAPAGLFST